MSATVDNAKEAGGSKEVAKQLHCSSLPNAKSKYHNNKNKIFLIQIFGFTW